MTYALCFVNIVTLSLLCAGLFVGCGDSGGEGEAPGSWLSDGSSFVSDAAVTTPPSSDADGTSPSTPSTSAFADAQVSTHDAGSGVASDAGTGGSEEEDPVGSASEDSGAGDPLSGLIDGIGGLLGDGGAAPSSNDGGAADVDGGVCAEAVCFDVFDCYIFHPDKVDCGFTACDGFVCK